MLRKNCFGNIQIPPRLRAHATRNIREKIFPYFFKNILVLERKRLDTKKNYCSSLSLSFSYFKFVSPPPASIRLFYMRVEVNVMLIAYTESIKVVVVVVVVIVVVGKHCYGNIFPLLRSLLARLLRWFEVAHRRREPAT